MKAIAVFPAAVCGTDRKVAAQVYGPLPPESPYLIIGHESLENR